LKKLVLVLVICSCSLFAQSPDDHVFLDDGVLDYSMERNRISGEVERLKDMISGKTRVEDKTISTIFDRNKKWKNMLVIADLTGSMSPYTAQLVIWLKLNMIKRETKCFVFFNDGDATPDGKKKIGSTGGIYMGSTDTFEKTAELAYKTMNAGGGGDSTENDVEALIKGIEKFGDCEEIVLIADNLSNMRDISLMKDVKRPVRVILCGANYGINVQYLELARATGGSVHTIEADIVDLMKLKEGQSIKIGKEKFIIQKGKFVKMAGV
jgi:hypothetical protein